MAMCVLCMLLTGGAAQSAEPAPFPLDDFEDGSDSGWRVVGHGPALADYQKRLFSPGCSSAYALSLSKGSAGGWCGLGAPDVTRLGLLQCSGVQVAARSVRGVAGLLVDAHLADGSRWWCKAPLPADGSWTVVTATADRFFAIDNPKNAPRPDLSGLSALWLTVDGVAENAAPPWEMAIDDVVLLGVLATAMPPALPAAAPAPVPAYSGPRVRVGVLDGDAFLPGVRPAVSVASGLTRVLQQAGVDAALVPPTTLAARLDAAAFDVLVLTTPMYLAADAGRILRHLQQGKALWAISSTAPLSQPLIIDGNAYKPATAFVAPPEFAWILDGAPLSRHGLELSAPQMALTAAGQAWWPDLPERLPVGKCSFLAADDSIYRPCTPPWVEVTPLLQVAYAGTNWIAAPDVFTGWSMVMLAHRAGPFAGARILYAGLAAEARSILHPGHPAFGPVVVRCLEELAKPVAERWTKTPEPPLQDLPELTRANFLRYPGPALAPLNIGGMPLDNPTFFADLDSVGFQAIHVEVPWLEQPNAAGEVIDMALADRVMQAARKHGKRVIWDPYDFNWQRFQWTGVQTVANPQFRERFAAAMGALVGRYAQDPTLVAVMATPHTGTSSFAIDRSPAGQQAWQIYVRDTLKLTLVAAEARYGRTLRSWEELPLPEHRQGDAYNLGPLWADSLDFFTERFGVFLRQTIGAIRTQAPDLPILLRGPYLEIGLGLSLARQYPDVALHCECVETSPDIEGYYRGLALSFGVPTTGENGWPKSRGGPLRMALADWLLGGYRAGLYSFAGPTFARPGILDFHDYQRAARALAGSVYPATGLALLIPDTTLYASEPPNFFSLERLPHLQFACERFGLPFRAVSSQFLNLDGVTILVDDGSNAVLTAAARQTIAQWVRAGGTLVAFPETGKADLGGTAETLAAALGIPLVAAADGDASTGVAIGRGRVVVLPAVPVSPPEETRLEELLERLGAKRPLRVTPRVNSACFDRDGKTYCVLYNKSRTHVGSFFRESTLPAVEAALPDLVLTVQPTRPCREARNVVTGERYPIANGEFTVPLPKTTWLVVELTP